MPQVEVGRFRDGATGSAAIPGEVEGKLFDRVRQRAFDVFQKSLDGPGSKVNDRLKTARDPVGAAKAHITEMSNGIEITIASDGFQAEDFQVVASARSITVHATTSHKHESDKVTGYFCELGQRQLFGQFNLAEQIDVESVAAHLNNGVLKINAATKEGSTRAFMAAAANGTAATMERGLPPANSTELMALVGQYSPGATFNENTTLDELGISSLERLMLTLELEQRMGILVSESELGALRTLGELAQMGHPSAAGWDLDAVEFN